MLRAPDARVLDVAVACGFKTQQHFAQAFRDLWGTTPTEYRQDLFGSAATLRVRHLLRRYGSGD
jgi:AraC family transcriptional regulator